MIKKKNICIFLVTAVLASLLCVTVSAIAEYNTNNHDSTFTVMGSLQGAKSGSHYINEYGTIRVDANGDKTNFSRLWCTVRLFAMQNQVQRRVDNGEVSNTIVYMDDYAGTSTYTFTAGTVSSLSASYDADAADGTSFRPDVPTETLILN